MSGARLPPSLALANPHWRLVWSDAKLAARRRPHPEPAAVNEPYAKALSESYLESLMLNDPFDIYEPAGSLHSVNAEKRGAWFNEYRNPQVRNFLKESGFASADDAMEYLHTLDARVGDGGDYVRLPRDGSMSLDERRAAYRRLGAPETPDGYDLQIPEERASDRHLHDFRETARAIFAEHDAPQDLAQALFAAVIQRDTEYGRKLATELREGDERAIERLKSEYGLDFTFFVDRGKRAVKTLGLDAETITGLEGSMGLPTTMKLLAAIGARLDEGQARFVGGQDQAVPKPEQMRAQDQAEIQEHQAKLEIDRHLNNDAFMQQFRDQTQPEHERAQQRFFELNAMQGHRVAADVNALTPEEARREITQRMNAKEFMAASMRIAVNSPTAEGMCKEAIRCMMRPCLFLPKIRMPVFRSARRKSQDQVSRWVVPGQWATVPRGPIVTMNAMRAATARHHRMKPSSRRVGIS